MWGTPLVILLVGGGLYFLLYSRFIPYRYFFHSIDILRGKYDNPDDPGDISHFQALSSALAATIGMGNISGVAVAIAVGGPGAVFWMWVSAVVGMATKFFTCTLSIMYRGKDTNGDIQGGTMYMIMEGLGKKWKPLAMLFAIAGLFGPLPIFQANQVTQIVRDVILVPNGLTDPANSFNTDLISGLVILAIVSLVIFGGIKRIGKVASRMVPAMVILYVSCVLVILAVHIGDIGHYLWLIVTDAFKGEYFNTEAAGGGVLGALIVHGVKRAAFSNEAGIGTATLAHGAAKTKEPVREGLVAMMGPFIDTLVVCTMTALAILVTGVWQSGEYNGITLTANAFQESLGPIGVYLLLFSVLV
ncbi:MAG: amino acid carrier protein, partial [Balneolales bacterium]|nr:amino acid carrier protein [Balneolales bacterium]